MIHAWGRLFVSYSCVCAHRTKRRKVMDKYERAKDLLKINIKYQILPHCLSLLMFAEFYYGIWIKNSLFEFFPDWSTRKQTQRTESTPPSSTSNKNVQHKNHTYLLCGVEIPCGFEDFSLSDKRLTTWEREMVFLLCWLLSNYIHSLCMLMCCHVTTEKTQKQTRI